MMPKMRQANPLIWLLLLLTVWALLAASHLEKKTASGNFYVPETVSGEMTGWEAAPRLGFGGLAVKDASGALVAAKGGTYVLKDAEGVVSKTGRTNDLARREAELGRKHPDKTLEVDKRTDSRSAQRGREQDIHDANPSAHAQNGGLDRINGIDPKNPRRDEYLKAGRELP